MSNRVKIGGLKVDPSLYHLVNNDIAPGTGVDPGTFWRSPDTIVRDLAPKNRDLLDKLDELPASLTTGTRSGRGMQLSWMPTAPS